MIVYYYFALPRDSHEAGYLVGMIVSALRIPLLMQIMKCLKTAKEITYYYYYLKVNDAALSVLGQFNVSGYKMQKFSLPLLYWGSVDFVCSSRLQCIICFSKRIWFDHHTETYLSVHVLHIPIYESSHGVAYKKISHTTHV